MFGKNNLNNSQGEKKSQTLKSVPGKTAQQNLICADTIVNGSLQTKSDLRIFGTIDGQVCAESKCFVSESGVVKGDMRSIEADIAGTIEGELLVSNRLILRSSAKVSGDIMTKVLMVEEGALIEGACKMGDQIDIKLDNIRKEGRPDLMKKNVGNMWTG